MGGPTQNAKREDGANLRGCVEDLTDAQLKRAVATRASGVPISLILRRFRSSWKKIEAEAIRRGLIVLDNDDNTKEG